jgi:hypothetical protein
MGWLHTIGDLAEAITLLILAIDYAKRKWPR